MLLRTYILIRKVKVIVQIKHFLRIIEYQPIAKCSYLKCAHGILRYLKSPLNLGAFRSFHFLSKSNSMLSAPLFGANCCARRPPRHRRRREGSAALAGLKGKIQQNPIQSNPSKGSGALSYRHVKN